MIFGHIKNIEKYHYLDNDIKKCLNWFIEKKFEELELGTYSIDDNCSFVNIVAYQTEELSKRKWEAHRKNIDIHVMVDGTERIDINFIDNMEQGKFIEEEDFLEINGDKKCEVVLEPGDFLICYPEDGHKTGISVNDNIEIKKMIFKVRI